MPVRKAKAIWEGSLTNGKGKMMLESGAYEGPFSAASRFEEGEGTNPEELIGAAHAGCFSMALSADLSQAGFSPKRISTTARVHIDKVGGGYKITTIELNTEAEIPGIEEKEFLKYAEGARKGCPVSRALGDVDVKLQAKLVS